MTTVVIVDDEPLVRELYSVWLEDSGYDAVAFGSAAAGRDALSRLDAQVLLSDIRMTTAVEGLDLLAWTRQHDPSISVVLITGVPEVSTAVEALRLAAYDYLVKPVPQEHLLHVIAHAAEHTVLRRERARLEEENRRYQQHLQALVDERTLALQRRTNQLILLNKVVSEINALHDNAPLIVERAVSSLHDDLGYRNAQVHAVDRASGATRLVAAGAPNPVAAALTPDDASPGSALFPISVAGMIRHVLVVPEQDGTTLDEADTTVLSTLTEHLGIALANADLYGRLRGALLVREQILQNVSHELRTPLTLISGYTELLAEDQTLSESAAEMLAIIVEQTEHLGRLVNQLLTFQSIEADRVEMELMVLNQWLESQTTTWRPILERAGLQLHVDCPESPLVIYGSWDLLSEALQNLLDNARKFSPQGGAVRIVVRQTDFDVIVSVSDDGIGVAPEKLAMLFNRFYQADSGVTRRFGGMGLGLALVREIVASHGGRVWAESPGEGAGFTVSFALPVHA